MRIFLRAVVMAVALIVGRSASGAEIELESPVKASLVASTDAAAPGSAFTLGLRLVMKPHWHTYWINPGESGAATKLKLTGPPGFEFGEIQWPIPKRFEVAGGVTYGYEGEVLLMVPVKVGPDVRQGETATISGEAWWLCCKETCIEGKGTVSLSLPISSNSRPANAELFERWREQLPVAMADPSAQKVIEKVEQGDVREGSISPSVLIQWRQAPRKVEWFPVATEAVAIENVAVRHEGQVSRIQFKPTVYKAQGVGGGQIESVVVYEDGNGRRRGIRVPVGVIPKK